MNPFQFILFLTLLWTMPGLQAQPLENPCGSGAAQKDYEKARELRIKRKMDRVEDFYLKALAHCPEWSEVYVEMADHFIRLEDLLKAEVYLEKAVAQLKDKRPALLFYLGRLEYRQRKFEEAGGHLESYLSMVEDNAAHYRRSKELLAHCRFAAWALEHPVEIDPRPLGPEINSPMSEYLPVLTADENTMIFTRRVGRVENIFYSNKKGEEWLPAVPMDLQDLPFRKGAFHISPDGKLMVFAMADHPSCLGGFDLFYIRKVRGSWQGPFNLGRVVNTPGWESQPSIGPDNRTVYFASDRKGGEGHKDIWRTRLDDDGNWEKPVNLGPSVNTRLDEASPYLHRDGRTLYFRSRGHPGMGDFDIFMSKRGRYGQWSVPKNLGFPINTAGSEGSLFVSINGKDAWYASDILRTDSSKLELQQKDIFRIELPASVRPTPATYIRAMVYDDHTKNPLRARVSLVDYGGVDTLLQVRTDEDGEFMSCVTVGRDYAMQFFAPGYLLHTERFEVDSSHKADNPFAIRIGLRPIPKELELAESEPVILQNVLFKFGTSELLPGSVPELNALVNMLGENPGLRIRINGHTDNIGSEEDNLTLSTERARTVYDFLVRKGIDPSRLEYRGYGENRPISDNKTEVGRKKNRRVEFKPI